ncbi:hypothetical protein GOZ70_20305 [Vibrio parahaemolyticus]|uniref:beta-ketoacyl synthase N-terminal-like domain-containing protein n=1 Tax=Vibrio sp. M250220 TaxID=3020894 RepID=UPI002853D97C|nr:hypothetical protein [Vibrio parahaemolyticus]ELC3210014.1 hypothetical protein [Vibrio parahaemolyticus]
MNVQKFVTNPCDIAIVGMSGRFPGARSIEAFWKALLAGVELTSPSIEEYQSIETSGTSVRRRINLNNMVQDPFSFDAAFFDISPSEAKLMDPQHRLALECSYDALTRANIAHLLAPSNQGDKEIPTIGLFASKYSNTYLLDRVYPAMIMQGGMSALQSLIGNDSDHLAPFIAYKLGLQGPVMSIQNACSSSLVSVHVACDSLISGQCDVALVTSSTISMWQNGTYEVVEGALTSSDGHCKPFSENADGTIYSNGVCSVVLKRIHDAIHDGSEILSVIRGSSINNDGVSRLGYAAPSVAGQKAVIAKAQEVAAVDGADLSFIECHGTGTSLGDKLELQSLSEAIGNSNQSSSPCYLSSVKANIGHLGVASGLAGLIKASLALDQRKLPPQINCANPVPLLGRDDSQFKINPEIITFAEGEQIYAGVSSFGLGGTNAHVILSNWSSVGMKAGHKESLVDETMILPFSARTETGLEQLLDDTVLRLEMLTPLQAQDIARILHFYREDLPFRAAAIVRQSQPFCFGDDLMAQMEKGISKTKPQLYLLFPDSESTTCMLNSELLARNDVYVQAESYWRQQLGITTKTKDKLYILAEQITRQCAIAEVISANAGKVYAVTGHGLGLISAMLFSRKISGQEGISFINALDAGQSLCDLYTEISYVVEQNTSPSSDNKIQLMLSKPESNQEYAELYLPDLLKAAINPEAVFIEVGAHGEFTALHNDFSMSGQRLAFHAFSEDLSFGLNKLQAFLWCHGLFSLQCPVPRRGYRPVLPVPRLNSKHFEMPSIDMREMSQLKTSPELPVRQHLQHLWHEVFGVEAAVDDDIIFEYGATSLTIARFVETVQRELNVQIEIADVYEMPSFARQISFISSRKGV